jgi:hypothetical protein
MYPGSHVLAPWLTGRDRPRLVAVAAAQERLLMLAFANRIRPEVGLGRIVALYHRLSTLYHIH